MKLWILIALLVAAPFVGWHFAKANITCGIAPIPPVGCTAICVCDDSGCGWQYICR